MIGFGLATLRARNEILDMEIGLEPLPSDVPGTLTEQSHAAVAAKEAARERRIQDSLRREGLAKEDDGWTTGRE